MVIYVFYLKKLVKIFLSILFLIVLYYQIFKMRTVIISSGWGWRDCNYLRGGEILNFQPAKSLPPLPWPIYIHVEGLVCYIRLFTFIYFMYMYLVSTVEF